MLEEQRNLKARFASIRDARTGPVFFIEHGLSEPEIDDLIAEVRAAVKMRPLNSEWWDLHKLPLIVAATEVGYRYRGSGSDFWPVLEEEIDAHIAGPTRRRIRDLFVAAATAFRGAHPPATPWAGAFHLIAWPITHALVPIEYHRPLALTLAKLRVHVPDLDDESLHRAIRIAAANSSARFSTLLESANLVVPVVRSLLGAGAGELSPEATQRIADDLAADHVARRGVAVARRVQRVAPTGARTKTAEPIPSIKGNLRLRRDRALTLEASFPTIDPQLSLRLRRALRRRRFAPKLWGVTVRVPSEQLLSGLPFALKLRSAPADNAVLLPGLEWLDIDAELREILEAFELRLAPPLLFAVGANNEVARLVHGPSISGYRTYWLLTSAPSAALARCPTLGETGPYTCYALKPADEGPRQALAELGFLPRFGVSVAFAGTPALDRDASIPAFVQGDQRVVVPRHSSPEGVLVELDGSETRVADGEVARIVVPEGEHLLRVSSGGESNEFAFRGVSAPASSSVGLCLIDARSTELTVQGLMSGRLAFTIDSFAPLEGLELTVEFEAAKRRLSASAPLAALPQTVTSKHEPFTSLLDDATRELLLDTQNLVVHLRVGYLCARSWTLERRVRPCWWVRGSEGGVALKSELGEMQYGEVAATAPHLPPTSEQGPPHLDARLLAPVGLDSSEYGTAARFATLCLAPRAVPLEAPAIRKPRLQRRRRTQSGAEGLEDLVEAYLRWSLADSDTVIAEIRRRQVTNEIDGWIAEVCCGANWCDRESEISSKDPWDLLVDIGHDRGLGRDSYCTLPDDVWRQSLEVAVAAIRHELPNLWSLARPPCDLMERDWLVAEEACDSAFKTLKPRYKERVDIANALDEADASADFDPDAWQEVLEAVLAQSEVESLAALLLPTNTAHGIMALDPSLMSLHDLCDEFHRWAELSEKALAGDVPTKEMLRAIVALWTEPEVAVNLDWRGALDTMIAERSVARAGRYLALRSRQARRGGVA